MILVTAHRRESFGEDMRTICHSLLEIARNHPEVSLVFPVHLNPNVQRPVREILKRSRNVHLIPPQDYETFVWLMMRSYLILTDSGGIQEEAPALHKPVLVMRRVSERPEGIKACTTRLVGINQSTIVKAVEELMGNTDAYRKMAEARNPYGDGTAAARIVDALISHSGISYHSTC
jgi:UDP-N-acetylglucosamine 2-epimerase (non-hydrolysing)